MPVKVRIALVDDHQIFLQGLSLLIEGMSRDFETSAFSNPVMLIEKLRAEINYDLVISDLTMNEMSGLNLIAQIRSIAPKLPILILTGIANTSPLNEIKALGAEGFVHKSAGDKFLREAIESLLAGKTYYADGLGHTGRIETTINRGDAASKENPLPKLAPRQIEVLKLISIGASNREISRQLSISENTVKAHLRQIFGEMGVNKRTACVRRAQSLGII